MIDHDLMRLMDEARAAISKRATTDMRSWDLEYARRVALAAEADAIERCAGMVEVYLADHGIEQARECLPDAIRALLPKEEWWTSTRKLL